MTEREKMLNGLTYNSRDPALLELYWKARRLLHVFNQSGPRPDRMNTFQELVPQMAEGVWVEPPFFCEYGQHIQIGRGTYINLNCFLQDCGHITIGECGLLGPGVQICTASHPVDSKLRIVAGAPADMAPYVTSADSVVLGNRVWIGASVTILRGVTIGDDVVIGAGSVVTESIPTGSVAYGVPCRVEKKTSST